LKEEVMQDFTKNEAASAAPQFLSIADLVSATRISRQTICRKLKLGEIPFTRVGKRILIPASYLAGLEAQARPAVPEAVS
jgi:excisionase family DNA binding protein